MFVSNFKLVSCFSYWENCHQLAYDLNKYLTKQRNKPLNSNKEGGKSLLFSALIYLYTRNINERTKQYNLFIFLADNILNNKSMVEVILTQRLRCVCVCFENRVLVELLILSCKNHIKCSTE